MKYVLVALPNDTLGGAEQYLKNLSEHFIREGYHLKVCFLKRKVKGGWSNLEGSEKVELFFTDSGREIFGVFSFIIHLWQLRKINFNFIFTSHVHLTGLLGLLIIFKVVKKKYFIGRESTLIFQRFKGLKLFFFKIHYIIGYRSLDLLICQTSEMRKELIEALPNLKIKIKVIPNPINLEAIKNNSTSRNVSIKYDNYIVSAGRLIPEKGFDLLIDAFSKLKMEYPKLDLVILGEGKSRGELEKKIEYYKLKSSIFLPGYVSNVYPYFKNSKLCVVSSRIEGFPNVLLQMMSQNDKVVSTKCADGIDKIPGISISEINDVDGLFMAMKRALNSNNNENRILFDEFLAHRSIENFTREIDRILVNE